MVACKTFASGKRPKNSGDCALSGGKDTNRRSTVLLIVMRMRVWALGFVCGVMGCADSVEEVGKNPCDIISTVQEGEATFYYPSGPAEARGIGSEVMYTPGACGFALGRDDTLVAAVNSSDYKGSALCGACLLVIGPGRSIIVRVVDVCIDCGKGDLDLGEKAFALLADTTRGKIPIRWSIVGCPERGVITYHVKEGSNPWWTAVQIRNSRFPVSRIERRKSDGTFELVQRTSYNYFVGEHWGPGPFTFRVTDTLGRALIDTGIGLLPGSDIAGKGQFPPCE